LSILPPHLHPLGYVWMRRESMRKDSERKDGMRKEREWKVKGLFWLFGLIESGLESERKEIYFFN